MYYYEKKSLIQSLAETLKSMLAVHSDMKDWLTDVGVQITDAQFDKLAKYLQLLKDKNEDVNLTRITDNREAWIKHILDSLMAAPFFNKPGLQVCDIGTGGGLPGIPLAILFPSANFTLVDATQKKILAVGEFAHELNLNNVRVVPSRIETLGRDPVHREYYDIVTARALAPLRVLLELGMPLIHPYGHLIAFKGSEYLQELSQARGAVETLRVEQPRILHYELPEGVGSRSIITVTKKTVTDMKYPRRDGRPSKSPL